MFQMTSNLCTALLPLVLLVGLASALPTTQQERITGIHPEQRTGPVLVTGATGRTGSLVYLRLKQLEIPVRALVRNASKAREMLGCTACDEAEVGIKSSWHQVDSAPIAKLQQASSSCSLQSYS